MSLSRPEYVRRVLIAVGLVALAMVLFEALQLVVGVVLVLFLGVLLAVFLDGLARLLSRIMPLPRKAALGVVLVVLVALVVGGAWFAGPRLVEQTTALADQLPRTVEGLRSWLQQYEWGRMILERMPESSGAVLPEGTNGFGVVQTAFSTVFGALVNGVIVLFVGFYLALSPSFYVGALVRLVPKPHRKRAREVSSALGTALRHWLLGRVLLMGIIWVMTTLALWIFGIPLALILGLIAGVLEFIPYIGPLLSAVPAVLVALAAGPQAVLTVAIIYGAVQFVESYLLTPLVQKRVVSMPPALLITAQVVMGVLAGPVGVIVATPLTVVVIVLVQMLYVEDVLGDDVHVMGGGE